MFSPSSMMTTTTTMNIGTSSTAVGSDDATSSGKERGKTESGTDFGTNSNEKGESDASGMTAVEPPEHQETSAASVELPPLHFNYRWWAVTLYILFLIFCNVIIPCVLFYPLHVYTRISDKELIGIGSAALGVSSCFDAPFRLYRLTRHRVTYGPLISDTWWHLDFTMWTYTLGLLVFAFPLAIAPAIAFYDFFLMSTMMLVGPVGLVFLLSLFAPRLPFLVSSDPKGEQMKPAVYYTLEDVGAVDFEGGREWRRNVQARYKVSPPFRSLMQIQTIYWTVMAAIYCGITAAVTWTTQLAWAFGWVLGQFFIWALFSGIGCYLISKWGLGREREWWNQMRNLNEKTSA
ncbi:hypothetical protein Moror_7255 [Moniliophthora roreri MCA 2997]|uniref:Uncharacterized protein n=1 Tax=Moniliophthora roreri (strain MCA 2997) TaxID=1381753 RepID=V2XTL8_MONRO|nr:hypothetical protein Moror_7255 [Moniliophthora roreri MCA 2997]